jgi:outer membrane lipoprotein SlyB
MSNQSVFCIASSHSHAEHIVEELKKAHFSNQAVSILFQDKNNTRDFAPEHQTMAPEAAVTGAIPGGLLGGTLGWIAGIGAFAIPGVGPFIAAGPLMAALGGTLVGATAGGVAGALIGFGMPEIEAKRFEEKLQKGNTLMSVHITDIAEIGRAKRVFSKCGAHNIYYAEKKMIPSKNKEAVYGPIEAAVPTANVR